MSHLLKKAVFILNFTFLPLSCSFAALHSDIDIIASGNGDYNYRWHNNGTLLFMCNNADQTASTDPYLEVRSFAYGTLSGFISGVLAPIITTRYVEPFCNSCCPAFSRMVCSLSPCCRRQSSEDMDIRVDLLRTPIPEEYGFPLRALDSALSRDDSGWNKYVLVDTKRYVVGYRYELHKDDKKIVSLAIVKDHKDPIDRRKLLSANKDLLEDTILSVSDLEALEIQQLRSNFHSYTQKSDEERKKAISSKTTAADVNSKRRAKTAWQSEKSIAPAAGEKDDKKESKKGEIGDMAVMDDPLQRFKQAFSHAVSPNVRRLINGALSLYTANPSGELKINADEWFAYLDLRLKPYNFGVYFMRMQDKP